MATVIGRFSEKERGIVLKAMRATAAHIDESEMHSRLGVNANEFANVVARWPEIDVEVRDEDEFLAVHNSLNEVCNGFRIKESEWSRWFDVPMEEIMAVYRKWLVLAGVRGGIH
jgi:hypothetical protein